MKGDRKLLDALKRSKADVGFRQLDRLYTSFGFVRREGKRHVIYTHPRHPQLQAAVSRKRSLAVGHVTTAIRLVERAIALEEQP